MSTQGLEPVARCAAARCESRRAAPRRLARRAWSARVGTWFCALLSWPGCASNPPEGGVSVSKPTLEVEVSGCAEVTSGPVCVLRPDRTLRLWVRTDPSTEISAFPNLALSDAPPEPILGGRLLHVTVPADVTEIGVTATRRGAEAIWKLPVATPPISAMLADAIRLRRAGRLDEALARLEHHGEDGPPTAVRAAALGLVGRIAAEQGRTKRAVSALEQAIELDRASGRLSAEVDDTLALFFIYVYRGRRYAEARALLERPTPAWVHYPDGRARRPYYQGLLAKETGDFRTALRQLARAARQAEKLGLRRLGGFVLQLQAELLQTLGRDSEAAAVLAEAQRRLPEDASSCERADRLTNRGWHALVEHEMDPDLGRAVGGARLTVDLEDALALYRQQCPDPTKESNVLTNLALAAIQTDRPQIARRHLAEARRVQPAPTAWHVMWWQDLEGRVALKENRATDALARYESLGRLADTVMAPEARWRATLGQALAREMRGEIDGALAAYARGEQALNEQSLLVPLGEGRGRFLGLRDRGTRYYIDLLMRVGRGEEAARVARRARARLLATLRRVDRLGRLDSDERSRWEHALSVYRAERAAIEKTLREDWRQSVEELANTRRARQAQERRMRSALDEALSVVSEGRRTGQLTSPDPGEVLLVYHPNREGWAGFAISSAGVVSRDLGPIDLNGSKSSLAQSLLEPFRSSIAAARRLKVLPYGPLRRVDFHGLPWQGDLLIAHLPVAYGLDLPAGGLSTPRAPPQSASVDGHVARALVIADTLGDLSAAPGEARGVESALAASGQWQVQTLVGRAATHTVVKAALGTANLLHYAGHGKFAGLDGWESMLPLAGGGHLTLGDILALPRAPAKVVLLGCSTARASPEAAPEGLGLAHAFLTSGSKAVVAAARPVADTLAAEISSALYRGLTFTPTTEVVTALRDAQLSVRARYPRADWTAFRAVVP